MKRSGFQDAEHGTLRGLSVKNLLEDCQARSGRQMNDIDMETCFVGFHVCIRMIYAVPGGLRGVTVLPRNRVWRRPRQKAASGNEARRSAGRANRGKVTKHAGTWKMRLKCQHGWLSRCCRLPAHGTWDERRAEDASPHRPHLNSGPCQNFWGAATGYAHVEFFHPSPTPPWRPSPCLRRSRLSFWASAQYAHLRPRFCSAASLTPPGHQSACSNAASAPRTGAPPPLHARSHAGFAQGPHAGPARRSRLPPMPQQHIPPVCAHLPVSLTTADTTERPQARTGRPRCHRRRAQAPGMAA
jgi:hypothetical protein